MRCGYDLWRGGEVTFKRALVFSLALCVLAASSAGAAAQSVSKSVPFPRHGRVAIGIASGPILVKWVRVTNKPNRHQVRASRKGDPDDTTTLRWIFWVANRDGRGWQARIDVQLFDAQGQLLADTERAGEVDARDWRDRISVWTRIKTLDYPRADHARITVTLTSGEGKTPGGAEDDVDLRAPGLG
jgi:hypothetical protein